MILLIPVNERSYEDAKIVLLRERKAWAIVEMDAGFIKRYSFFDDRVDIEDFVDFAIVKDKDENIDEFLDEGIDVLLAPLQTYIEDIVEAYTFRELHEI